MANVTNITVEVITTILHILKRLEAAFWALVATLISIFLVNGYRFGWSDQTITIPFLKSYLHPKLYPGDVLVVQKQYFLTYFWEVVSWFVSDDFSNMERLFFILYFVSVLLFYLFVFKLSMLLFRSRFAALVAVGLLIFRFETAGHVNSIELLLYTRQVTAFMLLAGFYYFLRNRFHTAFLWLAVAFLIHPLSAVYGLIVLFAAYILKWRELGSKKWLVNLLIPGAIIGLLFIKKWLHPLPEPVPFFADTGWLELLRIRSPYHIFPSLWKWNTFLYMAMMLVVYLLGTKQVASNKNKKHLEQFVWGFVFMFFMGWFFVEVVPLSLAVQFQFFRSSKLLFYLAIILLAGNWWKALENRKYLLTIVLALLSYGIIGVLRYPVEQYLFQLFVGSTVLVIVIDLIKPKWKKPVAYLAFSLLLVLAVNRSFEPLAPFTIKNRQPVEWLDVQQWARQNTAVNSVFITPPDEEGFRVASERSIYADWKEGTQMFFNPSFGPEWMVKMEDLGFNRSEMSFKYIDDSESINRLASEIHISRNASVYFVSEQRIDNLQKVFENAKYKVYLVAD